MPNFLITPSEIEVRTWSDEAGQPIFAKEGIEGAKQKSALVRAEAIKRGFSLESVPCVKRDGNKAPTVLKYFDLRLGQVGANYFCEILSGLEWRFATPAEVEKFNSLWEARRKQAAELAAQRQAADIVAQAAVYQQLHPMAYQPQPAVSDKGKK